MSKVLVTGGAGFIGSHVAELLVAKAYEVVVLDDLSQGNRDWVPSQAQFIQGDVEDLAVCRRAMQGVEGVFHLAAMSRVLPSLTGGAEMALFSAHKNIIGTINVLTAAHEAGCKKLVYSASSTYYGNQAPPHHEKMLPDCHTTYAASKYTGELYCAAFQKLYGLPTICLRYFQVYGPRQPVKGEYAMVTGIFIDQMKRGEPLTIHGDGAQSRDFVHVYDVAKANLLAFERSVSGETINIGTGSSHSIKQLANLISANQIHMPSRKHDLMATKADVTKCKALLGWVPSIGFEEGTRALLGSDTPLALVPKLTHHEFVGRDLVFDLDDMMVGRYLYEQIFHKREYEMLPGFTIKPGETVIDIGGNVGLFSMYAAAQAGKEGRVYTFEPAESNYKRLQEHIRLNHMDNIKAQQLGVGDRTGEATLYKPQDEGAYSLFENNAAMFTNGEGYRGNKETIKLTTLADIMTSEKIEKCDYLKIDCEGCEQMILAALPENYFAKIRRIVMEWHPNVDITEIEKLLGKHGYLCQRQKATPDMKWGMLYAHQVA